MSDFGFFGLFPDRTPADSDNFKKYLIRTFLLFEVKKFFPFGAARSLRVPSVLTSRGRGSRPSVPSVSSLRSVPSVAARSLRSLRVPSAS